MLQWFANFGVVIVVNKMPDAAAAAHQRDPRREHQLHERLCRRHSGRNDGRPEPRYERSRPRHSILIGYGFGGGLMSLFGILFILLGRQCAALLSNDPAVINLTAQCLFITGFIQAAFAAAMIFGSALKGRRHAGGHALQPREHFRATTVRRHRRRSRAGLRHRSGVDGALDRALRAGALMYSRFASGKWQTVKV